MTIDLHKEFSIQEKGVFTEDFLKDIDKLVSQYGIDWRYLTPEALLQILSSVEAHNSGIYVRVLDEYFSSEDGLDTDNLNWEIDPYLKDTKTGLILPSFQTWEYDLFIEEINNLTTVEID